MKSKLFLLLAFFAVSLFTIDYASNAYAQITSQGTYTIESNVVNNLNYTGQGVKVAVIDGGFNVTDSEISANIANYTSFRSDGNIAPSGLPTDHGTAVAQIVVDVVPDVELYLYNYNYDNSTTFETMVDHIIQRGDIEIATMSMFIPHVGLYDGTSSVSQKVNEARDSGILWINAAGNLANQHWNGTFTDNNSNSYQDFGTDDDIDFTVAVNTPSTIWLELTWDDPWGSSSNDYDLYVFNSAGGSGNFW